MKNCDRRTRAPGSPLHGPAARLPRARTSAGQQALKAHYPQACSALPEHLQLLFMDFFQKVHFDGRLSTAFGTGERLQRLVLFAGLHETVCARKMRATKRHDRGIKILRYPQSAHGRAPAVQTQKGSGHAHPFTHLLPHGCDSSPLPTQTRCKGRIVAQPREFDTFAPTNSTASLLPHFGSVFHSPPPASRCNAGGGCLRYESSTAMIPHAPRPGIRCDTNLHPCFI